MFTAAGTESDYSDSDCDTIVHSTSVLNDIAEEPIQNDPKNERNATSEFVAVSPPVGNGSTKSETFGKQSMESKSLPISNNNYHYQKERDRRHHRVVSKSDQPLDDLRYAIMQGNLKVIRSIIERGVYVDSILKAGWTSLMYACSSAHHEIVSYLLKKKADPNYHKDMFTPLMASCASSKGEGDLLRCCHYLLESGAHVNAHERHLTTPLMFAAREGHYHLIRELLQYGAHMNAQDNRGRTALCWAAYCGRGQVVHLLLKEGANINEVDVMGQTAADLAYEQGHKEIASLLEKSALAQKSLTDDAIAEQEYLECDALKKEHFKSVHAFAKSMSNSKCYVNHDELDVFLTGLELSHLISTFRDQHLDFTDLLIMNEEELEKVGIEQIGIRKKILEASKAMHKKEWESTSLPNLKQSQYISCPDAVSMMANIAKHLKYISSTITFVRQQIQTEPRILELSKESANVHDLMDEMDDSLKNVRVLTDDLRFFKSYLDKVQDNALYTPSDIIAQKIPANTIAGKRTKMALGFVIVTIAAGGLFWKKSELLTYVTSSILSKISLLDINFKKLN